MFRLRSYSILIFLPLMLLVWLAVKTEFFSLDSFFKYGIIIYFIAVLILGEIYARLTYVFWRYEFVPGGLKTEKGIIWKKYSNIPFERIQNVDVQRGIIARIFNFSSVFIHTAGYAVYSRSARSEGFIPAVDLAEAESIQQMVLKKIKKGSSGM
jgi:putative membrane protein